jgi:RNA polymerase sigma factor (TIGR02999 family)
MSDQTDSESHPDVTKLLQSWTKGNRSALDDLMPVVYDELKKLAAHYLRQERPGHTLQTTALVHEAYIRLVDQRQVDWKNRAQFLGIAAEMMRRILVNHALSRAAEKRGGGAKRVSLSLADQQAQESEVDMIALDQAMKQLAEQDERKSRIVELKFFGGMTTEEAAEVLGISTATVQREWTLARAWLFKTISSQG